MGLTQAQMAELVGIALRTYVASEAEERAMDAGELAALAVRGVNLTWLLTGVGSMMSDDQAIVSATAGPNNAVIAKIKELEQKLAEEKEKTRKWTEGARQLLTGCIVAADQISREQKLNLSPKQKAAMVSSMFIEMSSLTDQQIHTMMGPGQAENIKKY